MDLTNFGLKNTKSRELLLEVIKDSSTPLTAEQCFRKLPVGQTNLSTVYRTLQTFLDCQIIIKEIRPDGKALYSYRTPKHQHVLICIKCNKKIFLDTCPYKLIDDKIFKDTGFKIDMHNIELYGYCKDCQRD